MVICLVVPGHQIDHVTYMPRTYSRLATPGVIDVGSNNGVTMPNHVTVTGTIKLIVQCPPSSALFTSITRAQGVTTVSSVHH